MLLPLCAAALVLSAAPPAERAEALARGSAVVRAQWELLQGAARALRDPRLRQAVTAILAAPRPTFLPADAAGKAARRQALVDAGLLAPSVTVEALFPEGGGPPQSFLATAGSTLDGHHAYPGGLVEHTTFNLQAARSLAQVYRETAEVRAIDPDVLTAAVLLHDALKPYAMAWREDGTEVVQATVAGTASHHIFAIAEAIHRGLPKRVITALAAAHDAPGTAEARVVGFLRAGALLAGEDPVALGLVRMGPDGKLALPEPPSFEASINHLADHDYVLSEPSAHVVNGSLERLLRAAAPGHAWTPAELRWARYRVEAQVPQLELYAAFLSGGDAAVHSRVQQARVALAP